MKCPNCQKEIEDGSKFCQECGWKIEQFKPYSIPDNQKRNRVSNFGDKMIILTFGMVMVTLVIIIILMIMNIMNPMDSTQALTDAQNGVVQTSEPMVITQEKSESELEDDDNASDDDIRASYYQYEGELSTEPLKPEDITYIENEDILEYYRDETVIAKYKEAILKYAKDFASKRKVYGNLTIIKGCEPAYDIDGVIVDLHTDKNEDCKYVFDN